MSGDRVDGGVLLRVGDGEPITRTERREVVLLADRPEIAITWSRYAGGERGPDLHVHREHTDAFYVLEGELTFAVGPTAEPIRVAAGGFVAVPPDVVHAFANESGAEARWLNLHAPDMGFAAYMRALRDGAPVGFDSFDPPADGGRPAAEAIVSGPGNGERAASGVTAAPRHEPSPSGTPTSWLIENVAPCGSAITACLNPGTSCGGAIRRPPSSTA